MKKFLRTFTYSVLLLLLLSLNSVIFAETTVNLIATNDMHGVLEASDTAVGISQVGAIKDSTENALLIDSGDATQGTTLATINEGADIIKLMNAAGYDCMVAGNHEFDYGSERILENAELADFPILSANCLTDTGTLLPATAVIEKYGVKIGFVGVTTTITNTATNPNLRPGVTFGDEITAAKEGIAALSGTVDTIVLLTHMGDNSDVVPVTSVQLLDGLSDDELSQVSAVLDGHSHTIESEPYTRGNQSVALIQDQTQLSHVGKVALTFGDDGSVTAQEEVMDFDTAMAYPLTGAGEDAKAQVGAVFDTVNAEQSQITSRVIGQTQTPLWGGYIYWDYAEPRIVETNFGDLVSDAFKDAAQTYLDSQNLSGDVVGIVNGGGIGNSINPGQITYGDILNSFNHGNMAVVIKTTPAELFKVLENGLRTTGQADDGMLERESVSGSFIQCSGFSYEYSPDGPEGQKVNAVVLTESGKYLERDDTTSTIYVGTQNYVQTFFENADALINLGGEDSVISDYVSSLGMVNVPVDGQRIQITGDKSPLFYSVKIPVYNIEDTEQQNPLANFQVRVTLDGQTWGTYDTDAQGYLNINLNKGPHTIEVAGASAPVYVNNYSGSGTNYTKAGYYSLSFSVNPSDYVPTQDLSVSVSNIDLSTTYGSSSQVVTASVTPANATDEVRWESLNEEVASVAPSQDGMSATVQAVADGVANIVVSSGDVTRIINVIVSDNPIVASNIYVTADSPDFYTLRIENVHVNNALAPSDIQLSKVTAYTWSDPMQVDIDCKNIENEEGVNNYSYTFPINNTAVNNFYLNAQTIKIHVYASSPTNAYLIGAITYNYDRSIASDLAITPYCSDVGFITPSVGEGVVAGDTGRSHPLEGLRISTPIEGLNINTTVHVRDLGWMASASSGEYAGTMGLNKPIEAVRLELSGEAAQNYRISYRTTAADGSVSDWKTGSQIAGTTGQALPLVGIEVMIEPVN